MARPLLAAAVVTAFLGPCEGPGPVGVVGGVVRGTWGGDNAGLIAGDTSAHVHIACTYGAIPEGIEPGAAGRFDIAGEYVLRAYPVAVGPPLPARFFGTVTGRTLTLSVTVNDTTTSDTVTLGPVKLQYGREPQMQMCPLCRTRGEMDR